MHHDDELTTTRPEGWFSVQTVGPLLMVAFGLVLMFSPLASVGASGSVGNAGAQFPKCPPGGNAGNAAVIAPDNPVGCPTTTAPPTTAAPTTAPPSTAPPSTAAPTTAPSATVLEGVTPEQPQVEGRVQEAPTPDVPLVASDTDGSADAPATTELAFTGAGDTQVAVSVLGALLVLGGAGLLVASRRRVDTTC